MEIPILITDRALYIRIKVEHPLWSDEQVQKEIENLRNEFVINQLKELLNGENKN